MPKTLAPALILVALLTAPAAAAPMCSGSFALNRAFHTEAAINAYNRDMLRSLGVDVTRAEIWSGCIRVWVRLADGREEMQFYEPLNFRRVE